MGKSLVSCFFDSRCRVPGLSCGVVCVTCVILRLAVLVELRLVTDRQTDIGGGAEAAGDGGGHGPPMTGLGAPCTLGPPTLTPVDRNEAYCFQELVLNLPAPLDIQ